MMEIHDLPEFILHSRFLATKDLLKLAQMESPPEFNRELCEGTIESACELFDGKEKEIVLTRHAIQLLTEGEIELAWQALLAIHTTKIGL